MTTINNIPDDVLSLFVPLCFKRDDSAIAFVDKRFYKIVTETVSRQLDYLKSTTSSSNEYFMDLINRHVLLLPHITLSQSMALIDRIHTQLISRNFNSGNRVFYEDFKELSSQIEKQVLDNAMSRFNAIAHYEICRDDPDKTQSDFRKIDSEKLKNVKKVYIYNENYYGKVITLHVIPKEIQLFTGLKELKIDSRDLLRVPPEIGHLSNLETLDLSNSMIRKLPPEVGNLKNLKILKLCSTRGLKSLPTEIINLSALQTLDLHGSAVKQLPKEIFFLASLTTLDLGGSEDGIDMKRLPSSLGRISSLTSLVVRQLDQLPISFEQNQALEIKMEEPF